jgi:hypothetical protein
MKRNRIATTTVTFVTCPYSSRRGISKLYAYSTRVRFLPIVGKYVTKQGNHPFCLLVKSKLAATFPRLVYI